MDGCAPQLPGARRRPCPACAPLARWRDALMKWPWLGLSALFWASDPLAERAYVPPRAQDPMNQIVIPEILPTLEALFRMVAENGLGTTMARVPVFRPPMASPH